MSIYKFAFFSLKIYINEIATLMTIGLVLSGALYNSNVGM